MAAQISTKPLIIGCKCGGLKMIDKVWDEDLGWYTFWECPDCGYYWEGPML